MVLGLGLGLGFALGSASTLSPFLVYGLRFFAGGAGAAASTPSSAAGLAVYSDSVRLRDPPPMLGGGAKVSLPLPLAAPWLARYSSTVGGNGDPIGDGVSMDGDTPMARSMSSRVNMGGSGAGVTITGVGWVDESCDDMAICGVGTKSRAKGTGVGMYDSGVGCCEAGSEMAITGGGGVGKCGVPAGADGGMSNHVGVPCVAGDMNAD